jgi:hypothetical protein
MKPISLLLALFLLSVTLPAQQLLQVDAPEKSLGEMRPLDRRAVTFTLLNAADDSIFLGEPKPSCGCTATMLDRSTLAPGDSARLSVQFHASPGMVGPVNKSVTLYGRIRGVEQKFAVLRIHGEIVGDVKFEPGVLRFTAVIGDTVLLEALLRSNTDAAVSLENMSAAITAYVDTTAGNIYHVETVQARPFTAFTLSPQSAILEEGDSLKVVLVLHPQEKGQVNGTIRIPLKDTELRIPVVGVVMRQRE